MEVFTTEIITHILAASNEDELIRVISNSMSQLRRRKTFNESGYFMHMIVCLRSINTDDLPPAAMDNIKLAMAIFRQFQKDSREPIF